MHVRWHDRSSGRLLAGVARREKICRIRKPCLRPEDEISQIVRDNFDLRPKNLINLLDLKRPIYKNTASYGHFGRENKDFSWENTDISSQIK